MSFTDFIESLHLETQDQKEEATLKQLLVLENEFREHNDLYLKELQAQKEVIERLWVLTQRYIIMVSSSTCCQYPDIFTMPAADVILQEYKEKQKLVRSSNAILLRSLSILRLSCRLFEQICAQLDMEAETTFILGDTFHKPIAFFIELVDDCFKYFHSNLLTLDYRTHLFDPINLNAIDEYKLLLEPSEDFQEYLLMGLTYCKCLRPKPVCPTK